MSSYRLESEPAQWFVVELGGERYGIASAQVEEVVRAAKLVRVPEPPPALAGVLVLRGQPVPVLDLRARFGAPARPLAPDQFLVICALGARRVAIVVDALGGLARLDARRATNAALPSSPYARGVGLDEHDCPVILVDIDSILSARELNAIADAMARQADL